MSETAPKIFLGDGPPVKSGHFQSCVVNRDMDQPDMAAIVLSNPEVYVTKKIGMAVRIFVDQVNTSTNKVEQMLIYMGEIVGLEPTYKGGEPRTILIRAMNRMHLLLRKRRSTTFPNKTDKEILEKVLSLANVGLKLDWHHETDNKPITYNHVYQHNQTDLEFLRMRAARMGCHVWTSSTGGMLHVRQPNLADKSGIKLSVPNPEPGAQVLSFTPRMSSASIFNKVTVKGWNPETKEPIVGEALAQKSPLGKENAVAASGKQGTEGSFTVDQPIWSKPEADALAKARLTELSLQFITGEATVMGNATFELGKTVEIEANADASADDPFNGNYYIMGITHQHAIAPTMPKGGYVTTLRLARDAQKK